MQLTAGFSSEQARRARILAVDDVAVNLLALSAILESTGHEVRTARSGGEALGWLEREEFAVVLLDIQMPGMDGYETLERIRKGPARNTPVIFLTAHLPAREAIQRAYALGAFDFIVKPVDNDVLRGKVGAFVAHYQRGQELMRQAEALRAKDRHLAILAHELRTPLFVLRTTADELMNAPRERVPDLARRMLRSTQRMDRLTKDLLEAARAGWSLLPAVKKETDLSALCDELLEDFRSAHPRVQFVADIPRGAVGLWDRDRLYQALTNLLSNAVKYGDGRVVLELRLAPPGRASVTVGNGGAMISPARLPEIFEPFIQGHVGAEGVGLGLNIVREIIMAHGGDVVASSGSAGTRFTISLPLGAN